MLPVSEGWERFHPLTPLFSAGRLLAFGLLVGLQQLPSVLSDAAVSVIVAVVVLVAAASGGYGYLAWRHAGFRLSGDQLEIRRGIIFKRQGNVPTARIESVDLTQKAVPRALGLAEVVVEVASQGGGEAELKYLSLHDAERLRQRLDDVRRGRVEQAPAHLTGPPARVHLGTVVDRDLLFAYGIGPAFGAGIVVLVSLVTLALSGPAALLAFGIVGLLGIATGLVAQVRRVDRLYGLSLDRTADELHISRGFVEKLTQQIPLERIQAIRIDEPWLWRRFGRARLQVSVAGYRGSEEARASATAILMPVAPLAEIHRLVSTLGGPAIDDLRLTGPPRSARWRAPFWWRHTRIGHAPGFTVTQRGKFGRRTDFVTAAKLQSLRTTSGPLQRRLGLATLHLDTAGPGITIAAPHLAATDADHQLWLARHGLVDAV